MSQNLMLVTDLTSTAFDLTIKSNLVPNEMVATRSSGLSSRDGIQLGDRDSRVSCSSKGVWPNAARRSKVSGIGLQIDSSLTGLQGLDGLGWS